MAYLIQDALAEVEKMRVQVKYLTEVGEKAPDHMTAFFQKEAEKRSIALESIMSRVKDVTIEMPVEAKEYLAIEEKEIFITEVPILKA